jgi:hypothetical protein
MNRTLQTQELGKVKKKTFAVYVLYSTLYEGQSHQDRPRSTFASWTALASSNAPCPSDERRHAR